MGMRGMTEAVARRVPARRAPSRDPDRRRRPRGRRRDARAHRTVRGGQCRGGRGHATARREPSAGGRPRVSFRSDRRRSRRAGRLSRSPRAARRQRESRRVVPGSVLPRPEGTHTAAHQGKVHGHRYGNAVTSSVVNLLPGCQPQTRMPRRSRSGRRSRTRPDRRAPRSHPHGAVRLRRAHHTDPHQRASPRNPRAVSSWYRSWATGTPSRRWAAARSASSQPG